MRLIICLFTLIVFAGCAAETAEDVPEHLEHIDNLIVFPENPTPAGDIELTREVIFGETDEVLFKFYGRNGEQIRAFYYPYSNAELQPDDVFMYYEDAGEQVIHAIRSDDHPETWPAFHSLKLDDENRLWVSTIVDDLEIYEWWVLDEGGELMATFTWPRNRELKKVKNGYAYTMERDLETDLQEVVKYKINIGR